MNIIRKLTLAAALTAAFNQVSAADVKLVDSIAAVADNEVITNRQLNAAMARVAGGKPQGMSQADFRQQVLAQLINQSLVAQAGKRRNIQASEAEIDDVIAQTAAARKMTPEQLYTASAKEGMGRETMRNSVADSIIARKVQEQVVMQRTQVSDAEVNQAIAAAQANGEALPDGEPMRQYRAQHILIREEAINPRAAQTAARQVWDLARSGQNFDQLARQYSADSSAANGGDLGWFSDGQMVPAFENAVHQLRPGQVSAPVRSQFGWHIIKLNDIRETGTPEERTRNAMRQLLMHQKSQQAMTDLLKELHQNGFVDVR